MAGFLVIYVCYISPYLLAKTEGNDQIDQSFVTRETEQGTLQGVVQTARNGAEFHAFLGIPYAQPPLNELRWEKPRPAPNWEGVRNATTNPSLCMQEFVMNPNEVWGK